jgi:hypothetical protein
MKARTFFENRQLIGAQGLRELIKIDVRRRQRFRCRWFACGGGGHVGLHSFKLPASSLIEPHPLAPPVKPGKSDQIVAKEAAYPRTGSGIL